MTESHRDNPLDLAVHSMPKPQDTATGQPSAYGRWKLMSIILLCSLPAVGAYLAYFGAHPQGKAGFGELIAPVRPIGGQTAVALDGGVRVLSTLKGQWLLVSVGPGRCDAGCQQRLFLQRQLRETLGKDKDRVDWVWLISDNEMVDDSMHKPLADAVVLRVDQATLDSWLDVPTGQNVTQYLFVVDPMGNTMMRLPAMFDGAGAAKARIDLQRVLRASASWDGPGR
jgi:hypothetical protein